MFNKILVAVDHSERNKDVFNSAISLAQLTGANLMLLNVLSEHEASYPQLPTYAYYPILDDRDYDLYQEKLTEYKQWGLDLLEALAQQATEAGVATEFTQSFGIPGRAICELAQTWSADLIIVGSRGLKGIKEMFLGSVSNYVTHHAPCSVFIVRASSNTTASQEQKTNHEQEPTNQ